MNLHAAIRATLCAALMSGASACALAMPDRIHYRVDAPSDAADVAVEAPQDRFLGLALSGGGSRSAVFAAAAMEALAEHGLLDEVTHISSVSGGGFAAAHYLLHQPTDENGFETFRTAMRGDLFADVVSGQLMSPNRLTSPTRRLTSLQEALDERLTHGATFADLPASPLWFINASRYDDGRRFVFSNAALDDEPRSDGPLAHDALRAASFSAPGCARATPGDFPLSLAIATSAAFPVAFGPSTFEAPADCSGREVRFWHLGDGGVIENLGVETLEEVALRGHDAGTLTGPIVILSFDAELNTPAERFFDDGDLSIWTSAPGRIVDVAGLRGRAYHDLTWARVWEERGVETAFIHMRYTHAQLGQDWPWPVSCADQDGSPEARIADIPTSLRITECHADLMERAAHAIVHERLNAAHDALLALGVNYQTVPPHPPTDGRRVMLRSPPQ